MSHKFGDNWIIGYYYYLTTFLEDMQGSRHFAICVLPSVPIPDNVMAYWEDPLLCIVLVKLNTWPVGVKGK